MEKSIEIKGLSKKFKNPVNGAKSGSKALDVLSDVNIKVKENEFVSLLGPSGCGKSTLLKLIAGLDNEYDGSISLSGVNPLNKMVPVCFMLQKDCLMPWRSMLSNILLPLEIRKCDLKKGISDVKTLLEEFALSGFENYKPHQLSGGMRQRAALLRTYLMEGDIMLLDEPFGALDELTRGQMQDWLIKVWESHKKTVLFVTHGIDEAIFMSDRVLVMSGRPGTISGEVSIAFDRPRTRKMLLSPEFLDYKRKIMDLFTEF